MSCTNFKKLIKYFTFFSQACALAMGWRKCVFQARLMSNYWLRLNCYIDLMNFCFGCRSTQNKLMNDCHKWKQLNLIRRDLWRLRDKKRTEKAGSESDVQKGVWDTNRRERHLLMTALTIPFEVTGTLTFTCYSSHIRYKINLFQGILLDNHDCLATRVSV